jgi:hypothetical protein
MSDDKMIVDSWPCHICDNGTMIQFLSPGRLRRCCTNPECGMALRMPDGSPAIAEKAT